jgi:hypothetical protein
MTRCTLLLLAASLLLAAGALVAGDDAKQKKAAEQHKAALANWKRVFGKDDPPHHETTHLLLYGAVPGKPGKSLKEAGAFLESVYALAHKTLELGKDEPWPGKLTVYLLGDRKQFKAAVRGIERRLPEEEELGSHVIRSDLPHVLAGPPREPFDPGVDGQAGEQLAMALLGAKGGQTVPEWVKVGFGRATVFRAGPANLLAGEHRRAYTWLVKNKRTLRDVYAGSLKPEEEPVLRASLVEYLAYSGKSARFLPFLAGFKPQENRPEPTTEDAFKAANILPDKLNQAWQNWVRLTKSGI